MTISAVDEFTGYNWERYAKLLGGFSAGVSILFAIISWIAKYNVGIGVYTFFCGLLQFYWETPLYDCIPPLFTAKEFCMKKMFIENYTVRAVLYIFMSILTFTYITPCIAAGMFMLATSILMFFAAFNKRSDQNDGTSNLNENINNPSNKA